MLNVSHTTVSRSLNDSPLISKETKEKVKEIARKYNYRPNVNARSLVLSKSYTIGLFFSTLKTGTTASFFMSTVRGVSEVVKGKYNMAVEGIDDLPDFHTINTRSFDGVVVMSQSPNDDAFIAHVIREGIPVVVLNREIANQNVATILSDDLAGAYKVTKHMIEMGHLKLAIIEGKPEFKTTYKRKQGFINALHDAGIDFDEKYAFKGNYDLESGYQAMKGILSMDELPTAVFSSNDEMAVGAMKAVKEQGMRLPDDISIAGFDDMGFTAYLTPALTTISRPVHEMSREGASLLLEKIDKNEPNGHDIIQMDTELVVRESVKNLKS